MNHHEHHHYHHPDKDTAERLCRIEEMLGVILTTQESIMTQLEDIQAGLGVIDTKVATVKADVDALLVKVSTIPTPGMTPEQIAALSDIASHVQSISNSLGAIDAEVNPPPTV
jgi:hypothetical protein